MPASTFRLHPRSYVVPVVGCDHRLGGARRDRRRSRPAPVLRRSARRRAGGADRHDADRHRRSSRSCHVGLALDIRHHDPPRSGAGRRDPAIAACSHPGTDPGGRLVRRRLGRRFRHGYGQRHGHGLPRGDPGGHRRLGHDQAVVLRRAVGRGVPGVAGRGGVGASRVGRGFPGWCCRPGVVRLRGFGCRVAGLRRIGGRASRPSGRAARDRPFRRWRRRHGCAGDDRRGSGGVRVAPGGARGSRARSARGRGARRVGVVDDRSGRFGRRRRAGAAASGRDHAAVLQHPVGPRAAAQGIGGADLSGVRVGEGRVPFGRCRRGQGRAGAGRVVARRRAGRDAGLRIGDARRRCRRVGGASDRQPRPAVDHGTPRLRRFVGARGVGDAGAGLGGGMVHRRRSLRCCVPPVRSTRTRRAAPRGRHGASVRSAR